MNPFPRIPARSPARQRGLTLIEIMIALLLSLILTAGVIQIFLGSKQTYRFQEALSRIQESGRFAVEMINRDLRMVDYTGCGGQSIDMNNTLNDKDKLAWNFGQAVFGNNSNGDGTWTPALDASITNPDPSPASDVLTVRVPDLSTNVMVEKHPGGKPPGSAAIHVSSDHNIQEGDIIIATTCQAGAVMQVTSINSNGKAVHNAPATPKQPPGNATKELGANMTGGQVMKIATHTYYVAPGEGGRPSLWKKVGANDPQELVENVEQMDITYGEDTNGDRRIDQYVNASAVADWSQVLSARVSLLAASADDNIVDEKQTYSFAGTSETAGDRRLRQVFTTTAALRNRLP